MVNVASIDLGSHTARLLVVRGGDDDFKTAVPLVRKREYVQLAGDFDPVKKRISNEGVARAVGVMKHFSRIIKDCRVRRVVALATGVIRTAANRDEFLDRIFDESGLLVSAISGEREALLSGKGALGALGVKSPPYLVFDLGGGTTEFLCYGEGGLKVKSVALGAMVLTRAFLPADPPTQPQMKALTEYIHLTLKQECPPFGENGPVIGTGGTVTALCAMQNGVLLNAIAPEKMNGTHLTLSQMTSCLDKMRCLSVAQRMKQLGLDPGRAQVMVAGAAVATEILRHVRAGELLVSMADLLEGALMDFFEGEQHG